MESSQNPFTVQCESGYICEPKWTPPPHPGKGSMYTDISTCPKFCQDSITSCHVAYHPDAKLCATFENGYKPSQPKPNNGIPGELFFAFEGV